MREKSLWSSTTTTSHGNGKVWVKLKSSLKLEDWDTFLPNTMVAALFIKFFLGWEM